MRSQQLCKAYAGVGVSHALGASRAAAGAVHGLHSAGQHQMSPPEACADMLFATSTACVSDTSVSICMSTTSPTHPACVCLQVENVKNNLLLQLEILGRWLAVLVAVIAVTAFLLAMFHAGNNFKTAFESAVAVAVSIIPEGLPAMVRCCWAVLE